MNSDSFPPCPNGDKSPGNCPCIRCRMKLICLILPTVWSRIAQSHDFPENYLVVVDHIDSRDLRYRVVPFRDFFSEAGDEVWAELVFGHDSGLRCLYCADEGYVGFTVCVRPKNKA
jgi:hypothetical protein